MDAVCSMDLLHITLFGRLHIYYGGRPVTSCSSAKAQELLCYLLLHRGQPHLRETLASLLWGDHCTTAQSKKYLRKALWQVQSMLHECEGLQVSHLIYADDKWVQLNAADCLWLDVAIFEQAYHYMKDMPGHAVESKDAHAMEAGAAVYSGQLLDGWYQGWCLYERERLQQIYLIMLDKLMNYCEREGSFEAGLLFGESSLRSDRARERTYQQLMRLHLALGDRTGALRQFARCETALREELDVGPSTRTRVLYERIRQDDVLPDQDVHAFARDAPQPGAGSILGKIKHIVDLQHELVALQGQIQHEIEAVRVVLQEEHR
jgi:DNA-binding SARP family transcriptional activator